LIRRLDVALEGLRDQEALLREQAATDGLTKLANRVHFTATMRLALHGDGPLAVLLIDLDDFKTTNDTMGHAAGDALLVTVAERLKAAVGPDDVVARLGGDEFAVLLRGPDGAGAGRIAEDILNRLAEPMLVMEHTLATRASIGIAVARPGD